MCVLEDCSRTHTLFGFLYYDSYSIGGTCSPLPGPWSEPLQTLAGTGMRGSVHILVPKVITCTSHCAWPWEARVVALTLTLVPKLIATIGFDEIDKMCRERNCQARPWASGAAIHAPSCACILYTFYILVGGAYKSPRLGQLDISLTRI